MSDRSPIEWTDATWNPVTGCTKISPGCAHCYAERFAERFRGVAGHPYAQGFDLKLWPDRLRLPGAWRMPRRVFVNSMSDLFHAGVPFEYVARVFAVMGGAPRHTFQVLTKRADRLAELAPRLPWPGNVWMGVSVEDADHAFRVDHLRTVPARVRFLSVEPLLGPVGDLDLDGIHWVIAGGESGARARPMHPDWIRGLRDHCLRNGVRFFFKQWGGTRRRQAGRELDGRTWDEMPAGSPSAAAAR